MNVSLRVLHGRRAPAGAMGPVTRPAALDRLLRVKTGAANIIAARRAHAAAQEAIDPTWFWRRVKLEVERARRTERPFTMLFVPRANHAETTTLANGLVPHMRGTDSMLVHTTGLLILLGDTSGDDVRRAVQRLLKVGDGRFTATDVVEVAFPRDALTFGALVDGLLGTDSRGRLSIAG